jgi:iron(III) transport system ATP-binding protein
LSRTRPVGRNALPGRIVASLFLGTHTEYLVRSGEIRSRIWTSGPDRFVQDEDVWIGIDPEDIMVFPTQDASVAEPEAVRVGA